MNKQIQKLSSNVEQVLLGSLCGDGGLYKHTGYSGVCFVEYHNIKQSKYLFWKKEFLEQEFNINIRKRKGYNQVILCSSYAHSILIDYHKLFYPSGKGHKIILTKILNKLNPLGLAIWYQDDGTFNKRCHYCSFAVHKQNIKNIKNFFLKKLGMKVGIYLSRNTNGAAIRLNAFDTKKFFNIIRLHIHFSMIYKTRITKEEGEINKLKNRNYWKKKRANNREHYKNRNMVIAVV